MCECMMTSFGCSVSLSACVSKADVLMGQNWRALLPCVRITRWPLFPGHSVPDTSLKNELSKGCDELQTGLSNEHERKRAFLYPARKSCRAVLNRCAAVSSHWLLWNVKENICRIIYPASVVGGEEDSGAHSSSWVGVNIALLSVAGVPISFCFSI